MNNTRKVFTPPYFYEILTRQLRIVKFYNLTFRSMKARIAAVRITAKAQCHD